MLCYYLEGALRDLQTLIDTTSEDIEDIKEARHEEIFSRIEKKESLIQSFEAKKGQIDSEIAKISQENPNIDLEDLLDKNQKNLLNQMRDKLANLKDKNRHYARMVLAVSEFYNSLLERIVPSESSSGYNNQKRVSSFLQVKA